MENSLPGCFLPYIELENGLVSIDGNYLGSLGIREERRENVQYSKINVVFYNNFLMFFLKVMSDENMY